MSELNKMHNYSTPEDFIRHEILTKGNRSGITKVMMYNIIKSENIPCEIPGNDMNRVKKEVLFNALLTRYSYRDFVRYVGVPKYPFLEKYNITENQFNMLVDEGVFHRTISTSILTYDNEAKKYRSSYGYNVYDYFYVSQDMVDIALDLIMKRNIIKSNKNKKR